MDRRQADHGGLPVERGDLHVVRPGHETYPAAVGQTGEQLRVSPLGRPRVVPASAHDGQRHVWRHRADQQVDALVRGEAAHEQHALPLLAGRRRIVARGVRAAVDNRCPAGRRPQGRRGKLGDQEEPVEQPRQHPPPAPAPEPVVGDGERTPGDPAGHGREAARCAAHVMRVHHVGAGQGRGQRRVERVGRVTAQPGPGPQHAHAQPAGLGDHSRGAAKGDQLTVDLPGEGPGELQRVPLPAAEQPVGPEAGRSYLDDPHHVPPPVGLADNPR